MAEARNDAYSTAFIRNFQMRCITLFKGENIKIDVVPVQ